MGNAASQDGSPGLGSLLGSPGIPTVVIDVGTQYTKVVFTSRSVNTAFHNWPGLQQEIEHGCFLEGSVLWGFQAQAATEGEKYFFLTQSLVDRPDQSNYATVKELATLYGAKLPDEHGQKQGHPESGLPLPLADFLHGVFSHVFQVKTGKSPSETNTPRPAGISFLLLISPEWTRISLSKVYQHVKNTLNNQATITMIERSQCVRTNQTEAGMRVSNGARKIDHTGVAAGSNKLILVCELGALTVRMSCRVKIGDQEQILHTHAILSGAIFIERMFSILLRKKLQGLLAGPFPPPPEVLDQYVVQACRNFREQTLQEFDNSPGYEYNLTMPDGVPDDTSENIEEGTLTLSRRVVLSLFKPLLDSISDYCRASVKNLKTSVDSAYPDMADQQFQSVLFTGGLSNSLIVRKELEDLPCFKDVEKIFPGQKNGETAAVRTVARHDTCILLQGLSSPKFRSDLTLGFTYSCSWQPKLPHQQRQWDPYRCEYVANNTMLWFVHKDFEYVMTGQTAKVANGFQTKVSFSKDINLDSDLTFKDTIWINVADDKLPEFRDSMCKEFAIVHFTLPELVRGGLSRQERPGLYGGAFLRIDYELSLQIYPFVAARCLFNGSWYDTKLTFPVEI